MGDAPDPEGLLFDDWLGALTGLPEGLIHEE